MEKIEKFITAYINSLSSSIMNSDMENLHKAAMQILKTIKKDATIYVCGNGGSAAIANHYVVDFLQYVSCIFMNYGSQESCERDVQASFEGVAGEREELSFLSSPVPSLH